ncbi:hypothetical protein C7445_1333 [Alicyclobacillus sacchari]|uniref:Uncharacterized protein n=1 Tax=Alicyclobacillus sacchari TaxID=392010 RepID=A0A4R8L7Q5_9BACL|nr:hypothetical protein [Alicyclobacillus sacchari]TDY38762.1 hypothetical protein C7445_1333 [Alicyclobacillus sacchari]
MSMNTKEKSVTIQQLQHYLACEKLSHITSILTYRYGVKVTPISFYPYGSYELVLKGEEPDSNISIWYESNKIIQKKADEESLKIWTYFVSQLPSDYPMDNEEKAVVATFPEGVQQTCISNMSPAERIHPNEVELRQSLASERLSHIALILQYRYDIEAVPVIKVKDAIYQICAKDFRGGEDAGHSYSMKDMLECNAEQEAYFFRMLYLWHTTFS